MNAHDKFLAASAHVDEAAVAPLPNSRKIYVEGSRPDIRVPMREVSQADTPTGFGGEKNPPIYVYDCSGPYTDPSAKIVITDLLLDAGATRAESFNKWDEAPEGMASAAVAERLRARGFTAGMPSS